MLVDSPVIALCEDPKRHPDNVKLDIFRANKTSSSVFLVQYLG